LVRNWVGAIVRFLVSAVVLWIVGLIVPGFAVTGFWGTILAALVIALIGWAIEAMFGANVTPFGRGIVGFIVSAVVIYVAQFFVPGMRASILGAILAALVIGIIDLFIPIPTPLAADGDRNDRNKNTK
jgi:hypothetical protein